MRTLRCFLLQPTVVINTSFSFDIAMDPGADYAKTSTCTTCRFKEDASNYWTAVLYYKNPNGSYIRVS